MSSRKIFRSIVVVILFLFLLAGCSQVQDVIDEVVNPYIPNDIDLDEMTEETKMRIEISTRAGKWVLEKVPYGSWTDEPDFYEGYRTDCSGFVSYAWQLKNSQGEPVSPTTPYFHNYANDISFDQLKLGDAINNKQADQSGHIVLFVSWLPVNPERPDERPFEAIHMEGNKHGTAIAETLYLVPMSEGCGEIPSGECFTIKHRDVDINGVIKWDFNMNGPFFAQRLKTLSLP